MKNQMRLEFSSVSENEAFARVAVAAFISQLDPTLDEVTEVKTVVSEAVTNAIIHAYHNEPDHKIILACAIDGNEVKLSIEDSGAGIEDIDAAREPLYTSKPELERSGMGFTIIENFMDAVDITSQPGKGTILEMTKQFIKTKTVYN
ncbi:anti-sigma F factor [Oceanobacillus sp. FSL H7-0719]|uniref:anti-sigma F factor n=1 Tax=Oceanobacillus sp. FSL H7-0719 TaxID=2954507 RepID=UPI003254D534